ncbi:type I restriction enzyme S subunit [Comamonas sp. BIGb0152]|uniref:restriction endonuclease subunit S n=1 Tax=Comamonas sp. BIGb0152 TaxID=2940601 RepID=UPI0021683C44|nr:restriction endonuclease subunit S [Comamonas sp. BIGb0152]MCS4292617.1 type I restriction enzyme S subunit [Comamonas sp. BIGb0152]
MSNKKKTSVIKDEVMPAWVPKLRFPEFRETSGWQLIPLNRLAIRAKQKNRDEKIDRVLTNSAEFGVLDQRDFFDKDIATQGKLEGYFVVEIGSYVYNPRISSTAPVGPLSKNKIGTGVMSPLYTVFKFKDDRDEFYEHFFKTTGWHTYMRQASSTGARHDRMAISSQDFMAMPLPTPSLAEQQKIAECLSSVDELIAAQAREVDSLRTLKRGLMQQLFPREGETQPHLRFPEFQHTGEWERKTLKEIAKITSGTTPPRSNLEFFAHGTIPWVKTTDLNNGLIVETEEKITSKAKARINPADSVLIAMYGGFNQIGRTGLLSFPAATNQAISVLALDRKAALPTYVLAWLNAKVEDWRRIASSSRKDPNITSSDVAKFTIFLPGIDEQQRIADCLSSLETLIVAEIQKLEALKTHRKGLMQQLFPFSLEATV